MHAFDGLSPLNSNSGLFLLIPRAAYSSALAAFAFVIAEALAGLISNKVFSEDEAVGRDAEVVFEEQIESIGEDDNGEFQEDCFITMK